MPYLQTADQPMAPRGRVKERRQPHRKLKEDNQISRLQQYSELKRTTTTFVRLKANMF